MNPEASSISAPDPRSIRARWIGHATVVVEAEGVRVLTDPVLEPKVGLLRNRVPVPAGRPVPDVDAVVISHEHYDHLHLRSLRRLGRDVPLIVPRGLGIWLVQRGFHNITEVSVGEQVTIRAMTVEATRAEHGDEATPGRPRSRRIGFLFSSPTHRAYFAGDTDLFDEMTAIGRQLDLALLPVWGWGREPPAGHLTPDRAAEALTRLQPRVAVPVHWGTLRPIGAPALSEKKRLEPARAFEEHARRQAPGVEIRVLQPGESTIVV